MKLKVLFVVSLLFMGCSHSHANQLLANANSLLEKVNFHNNRYQVGTQEVVWEDSNENESISYTDCSGFINALFIKTFGIDRHFFKDWIGTSRPLAKDYYEVIYRENGFKRITRIKDILPGDIVSVKYFDQSKNTGHIMLSSGKPELIELSPADQEEVIIWKISIIDSSQSGHGVYDTRFDPETQKFYGGVGKGYLKIMSTLDGEILKYAWSDSSKSIFQEPEKRHLIVGRIVKFAINQ